MGAREPSPRGAGDTAGAPVHSAGSRDGMARACSSPRWRPCASGWRWTAGPTSNVSSACAIRFASVRGRDHAGALDRESSPQPLPTIVRVSHDAAGSSIDSSSYVSRALGGEGSFLIYLPPGYASTTVHYPVIYLLHGDEQTDGSFLQIGVQGTLDRLIARHTIAPVIAVMIQGGPGSNNWLNQGATPLRSVRARSAAARRPDAADDPRPRAPARSPATRWAATARCTSR